MSIVCGSTLTLRIHYSRLFTAIISFPTHRLALLLPKFTNVPGPVVPGNRSWGKMVLFPWKVYKLVIETLKYKSILESLISKCQIEKKEKWLGKGRCLCIVYEFLIGSGLRKMFLIIQSSNSLQIIWTICHEPYDPQMNHMIWAILEK